MTDDDLKIRIAEVLRKANEAAGFTVYTEPIVMMLRREPGLVSCGELSDREGEGGEVVNARPSFQFYPRDWLSDLAVRQCSAISRALWIDMICLMHEGSPYGHLADSAGDLSLKFLASTSGFTLTQVQRSLNELEERRVLSRTEAGTIYSRRMVKDEGTRIARANGGFESRKNANVPRVKDGGKDTLEDTLEDTSKDILNGYPPRMGTSSRTRGRSSSSSSSSSSSKHPHPSGSGGAGPPAAKPDLFDEFWQLFVDSGKALNEQDKRKACGEWVSRDHAEQQAAFDCAVTCFRDGTWPNSQLTPMPANYLRDKPWTRVAVPRVLPVVERRPRKFTSVEALALVPDVREE